MDSLDDVLSGNEVAEPEAVEPQQEVTTGEAEQSAQEDSTPPVEEDKTEDTVPQEDPKEKAFLAKAQDEKRKRQAAEDHARALEQELEALKQPQPEETDYWDDPKKAVDQTVNDRVSTLENNLTNRLYGLSENMARRSYSDFDEVVDYFKDNIMTTQPHLVAEARSQVDPAEFIYKTAKAQKELAEMGSPEDYRAKIEAEVRAKIEAETKANFDAELEKRSSIPGTLANQRATNAPKGNPANESLEDIFGR